MKRIVLGVALFALGGLFAGGVVWAQTPPQITACVERTTGYFKLGSGCGQNLTWNTQGPQGPAGPVGPQGVPGPPGPAGAPATGLKPTKVVYKNSAITKAFGHSATAMCPVGSTALYGGAGLIGTGKPDNARLRVMYSRPFAGQGVPRGWSAGAIRVAPDPTTGAFHLARAERQAFNTGVVLLLGHGVIDQIASTKSMFGQAVEAAKPAPDSIWGVQAWVVCGA